VSGIYSTCMPHMVFTCLACRYITLCATACKLVLPVPVILEARPSFARCRDHTRQSAEAPSALLTCAEVGAASGRAFVAVLRLQTVS
jgi:hypothetical protein